MFDKLYCGKTLHIRDKNDFILWLYYESISWQIYCRTAKCRECYVTKYGTFTLNIFYEYDYQMDNDFYNNL
jgi:hypothetical protein